MWYFSRSVLNTQTHNYMIQRLSSSLPFCKKELKKSKVIPVVTGVKPGCIPTRPILIHHVHLTPRAEHKRGQVSAFTAKACLNPKPNGSLLKSSLRGGRPGNPRVGGWEWVGGWVVVGVGGGGVGGRLSSCYTPARTGSSALCSASLH